MRCHVRKSALVADEPSLVAVVGRGRLAFIGLPRASRSFWSDGAETGRDGIDLVVIARRPAADLDANAIADRLTALLDRATRRARRRAGAQ